MLPLIMQGHWDVVIILVIALIISLTFHEYGHAIVARYYGDRTAELAGRLTLNPLPHIDPMGLLMVLLIGFGFAKPVPVDPRNFRSPVAHLYVAAAGPFMNLLIAIVVANIYMLGIAQGWELMQNEGAQLFFSYLAIINLILMIFNLIPLGGLDGHYVLAYLLPHDLSRRYVRFNAQYGNYIFFGLIALSIIGVPIFSFVWSLGTSLLPWITWVG
jgi:Zn-dependent protease